MTCKVNEYLREIPNFYFYFCSLYEMKINQIRMNMEVKKKKIIVRILWVVAALPFVGIFGALLLVGCFAEIPSFEELEDPESNLATELISDEGEVFATYHIENRSYVSFSDLSPYLVEAAVATEDARFYDHSGIDFRSLLRVGVKSILLGNKRSGGGGSTISQQLAKTLFPRDTTTLDFPGGDALILIKDKFKEWIIAAKLEKNYTKNEILSMYMNAVFFGSNSYGIKAAANTFFAKDPADLTIEESATLVGMVNKPTRFNPVINPDLSLERRNHVLSQMNKYGYLDDAQYDSIVKLPIILSYRKQDHTAGSGLYFRDMLRRFMNAERPERKNYRYEEEYIADLEMWESNGLYGWLNKNLKSDGTRYDIDRDGLKIYTTISHRMQKYAEEAVAEHLGKDLQPVFDRHIRNNRNKPFSNTVPRKVTDNLMAQARRWSDRYRNMRKSGYSEKEILRSFDEKTQMRVFSWKGKGYADTVMTPNDSIRYYKSILRAGFVAIEPGSGHLKAYVGGPDYTYFKYDNASQSRRQVGSTIKPFLYALAMQEGYSPCDKVVNVPQTFIVGDTTWTPESTDKAEWIGQTVTLKWGLTKSSNNISAYLMKQFGPEAMVEMCHKLGIKSHLDPVPSLCLGPADLRLMEMVAAVNSFPSRGVYVEPLMVTRIEDKDGNILSRFTNQKREAINERTAYLMVNLMQGVVNEGTAVRLRYKYALKGELAGKTGTSNDQSDGWFMGYTPKLTAGVWVGAEDRQVHFESLSLGGGSNMALPIWGIFMQKVQSDATLGITADDRFIIPQGMNANINCSGADDDISGGEKDMFFN